MSSYPTALQNETLIQLAETEAASPAVRVEMTDNQLVNLVVDGDHFAFEQIFDRHKRLVAIIASRYFRQHDEIEEVIQISFAKAYAEMGKFRGIHDRSLASWLVRITANTCFDTLRAQKRKPETLTCELSEAEVTSLLELTADDSRTAEKTLLDNDLTEKLLAGISADDRTLLEMLYAEEMSVSEIADVLGCSKANVKIRAWRARGAMRKMLRKFL